SIVPETPEEPGSVQRWVPHSPASWWMSSSPRPDSSCSHPCTEHRVGTHNERGSKGPSSRIDRRREVWSSTTVGVDSILTTTPPGRCERECVTALAKASPAHSSTASTREEGTPARVARSERNSARKRGQTERLPG